MQTLIKCTQVLKKTNAKLFKDVKVGDKLIITFPLENYCFSDDDTLPEITVTRLKTKETVTKTIKGLKQSLSGFKFAKMPVIIPTMQIGDNVTYTDENGKPNTVKIHQIIIDKDDPDKIKYAAKGTSEVMISANDTIQEPDNTKTNYTPQNIALISQ